METIELYLELRYDNYWEHEEVEVEEEVFHAFVESFAKAFAKKTNWYRFGSRSGKIIKEHNITYGDFNEFIYTVDGLKQLEKSIIELNPQFEEHGITTLSSSTLLSIDRLIFEEYNDVVEQAILKENNLTEFPKESESNLKTYEFEGVEVVFFDFYQACHGESTIYAVPVEVAERLCLEDYDGEEISRYSDFLEEIEAYEVKEDLILKASCIKAYNYS